ncbi:MAG: bifunctional DNA-formamidopyrimidine glycosylase/DNA-(apurinic or apyrimidinic site) lyase [Phycisphaeraceae bacterium]|nr:MAG: bifunctional DNA-formamidopyrimidine glycosylase/DNA-(apurinic or apyrimidinic site) lyase [Phycisphaeraceae bacterium]
MPELPEVETTRRMIDAASRGRGVVGVSIARGDVCVTHDGGAATPGGLLLGGVIAETRRRGKQLAVVARDGRAVVVHLGMSGTFHAHEPGTCARSDRHTHVTWTLDSGAVLTFRDPRRFGGIWTLPDPAMLERRWEGLGPDALEIGGRALSERLGRTRRAVKAALLDQSVIAGVGNIYADEALFAAGIRPARRCGRLTGAETERLAGALRSVLSRAVEAGGSSIRDYTDPGGRSGRAQELHRVYGRSGFPCVRCATPLRRTMVGQRTTVHCPRCQA